MKTLGILLCFAAVFSMCGPVYGFEVARDGEAECSIVLSPMASTSEKLAAEELSAYVSKISGAALPVRTEITPNRLHHQPIRRHDYELEWDVEADSRHSQSWRKLSRQDGKSEPSTVLKGIVIGTPDSLTPIPRAVRQRLDESCSEEAFYIKSSGHNVFVIGKRSIGALYGAYALLQDYMGVRWFHPGELGEHYPVTETLVLPPDIDDFQEPAMATRRRRGGSHPYHSYDTHIWGARNRLQIEATPALRWFEPGLCTEERAEFLNTALNAMSVRGGHVTLELAVPEEFFDEHPEYFTLKDGERRVGDRLQRCLSNPAVFKLVSEYALDWVNADPNNIFRLDWHDSLNSWCECDDCVEMGTVDRRFKPTNLFHRFFSSVADYVLEQNPEARLDVMFYTDSAAAPDDPEIRYEGKNVRGIYCTSYPYTRCYAHALSDPSCRANRVMTENLKAVLEICPRIYTFEYLNVANVQYVPVWKTTAQDIKYLYDMGVEGYMDIVHAHKWRPRWLSLYIGARLHWDTGLEEHELREDAYRKYYGAAASAMTEYHDRRLELWDSAPGHAFYGGPTRQAYCLMVPGAEGELRSLLDWAKNMAGDEEKVLARIGLDEIFLEEYWKKPAEELARRLAPEQRIVAEPVRDEIVIDGSLSEETWQIASPETRFFRIQTEQPPSQGNKLRIAYDDENIYIGFVASNDRAWSEPVARAEKRDSPDIWRDCHIEIQLAPPDRDGHFYHIVVNTEGVLYDSEMVGMNIDRSHDSGAEIAVKEHDDKFVYEIRLPLAPMDGDVSPGSVWGVFALRAAHNLQPPETSELSTLDGNRPHRVMEFRELVFGEDR